MQPNEKKEIGFSMGAEIEFGLINRVHANEDDPGNSSTKSWPVPLPVIVDHSLFTITTSLNGYFEEVYNNLDISEEMIDLIFLP